MGSTTGRIFRVVNFGESHGKGLGCVVENCPAGLEISETDIQVELDRRRPGQSSITTSRKEGDEVEIISGVFEGKTTGAPICLVVFNKGQHSSDYENLRHTFRPSHADYTYQAKYGHRDFTGGGRASARNTIGTVAAGAIARKILKEKAGIDIASYVAKVKDVEVPLPLDLSALEIRTAVEQNSVRCPDPETAQKMIDLIEKTASDKDSVGGVVNLVVENTPPGLGDPLYDRLDGLLSLAMMNIPAVKGVEVGGGFRMLDKTGSEANDIFYNDNGLIRTKTNNSGGIQGGISNGMPILMSIAFKPTATVLREQSTVNDAGEEVMLKVKGRHDPCVLPRAVPIVEAAAALVLVDQWLLQKTARYDGL